jgi:hypothetical protein|nr:MAG TPA: hypothetical protein [Caudoviricetes sp.]
MFDTANIVGDFMVPIYKKDDILVLFAPEYDYIEIFGISDEEFERVRKEVNRKRRKRRKRRGGEWI